MGSGASSEKPSIFHSANPLTENGRKCILTEFDLHPALSFIEHESVLDSETTRRDIENFTENRGSRSSGSI